MYCVNLSCLPADFLPSSRSLSGICSFRTGPHSWNAALAVEFTVIGRWYQAVLHTARADLRFMRWSNHALQTDPFSLRQPGADVRGWPFVIHAQPLLHVDVQNG